AVRGAILCLFLASGSIYGQAINGTVVGTVHDASGALVQGAKVSAKNLETGIVLNSTSSADGNYTIANVSPGAYDISAQFSGFTTSVVRQVPVEVQKTSRVDFTLNPGSTTEQIDVTAVAPLVQSTTSDLGHVVASGQIQSLPLNGRLFEQLVT